MGNLKNIYFRDSMSAYNALSEIVAVCGLRDVFLSLSEITEEQYIQMAALSPDNKLFVSDSGRQYVLTNNE